MRTRTILQQLSSLEDQKQTLLKLLSENRSKRLIKCVCGKSHPVKNYDAIQTHWYESPSGCSGGDMWHVDDIRIVCPETGMRNRLYFDSHCAPYEKRNHFLWSAEQQFSRMYLGLFKSLKTEFDENRRGHFNDWVDNHHDQFEIKIGDKCRLNF